MFRRRLAWYSTLLALLALGLIARLAQIQIAHAADYEQLATRLLSRPPELTPAPRGSIVDRRGVVLVRDEPTSDLTIHYAVLTGSGEYLTALAAQLRRTGGLPADMRLRDAVDEVRRRVQDSWARLSQLTGQPLGEFERAAAAVRERVERVRESVQRRNPRVRRIAEEDEFHTLLADIPDAAALTLRLELVDTPWIRVQPGARRVAADVDALTHVLGSMAEASPEQIGDDALADDALRRLRPGDRCGVSGVERLAETSLRGVRGRVLRDIEGRLIGETLAQPGATVALTIDADFQRDVQQYLAEAVAGIGTPAGGSAVVIDVATRDVLALVSYPTYSREASAEQYAALLRDTVNSPLLFRAVQARYPPGSICKAISLVGGLCEHAVRPDETFDCEGLLLPDQTDRFRCWIFNQEPRGVHGRQDAELAVKNSCNIYFFHVGERLGVDRLCQWFDRFGLGRPAGSGLIEEAGGVVPTAAWLRANQDREPRTSDAWNFAIGQGEVTVTPLQAANVAATIASGNWAPVRLVYDASGRALGADLTAPTPIDDAALHVLRRGMWRVVNDRDGTAHVARLSTRGVELCGKTGSAQTVPRVINSRYIVEWPDGSREEVIATSQEEALATFPDTKPRVVGWRANERYPSLLEGERLPAHAWFIGWTQPSETPRGSAPRGGGVYAISVVVEFGGSGGRVAGPVARRIAERLAGAPAGEPPGEPAGEPPGGRAGGPGAEPAGGPAGRDDARG